MFSAANPKSLVGHLNAWRIRMIASVMLGIVAFSLGGVYQFVIGDALRLPPQQSDAKIFSKF